MCDDRRFSCVTFELGTLSLVLRKFLSWYAILFIPVALKTMKKSDRWRSRYCRSYFQQHLQTLWINLQPVCSQFARSHRTWRFLSRLGSRLPACNSWWIFLKAERRKVKLGDFDHYYRMMFAEADRIEHSWKITIDDGWISLVKE